jgi:hypothetical protein
MGNPGAEGPDRGLPVDCSRRRFLIGICALGTVRLVSTAAGEGQVKATPSAPRLCNGWILNPEDTPGLKEHGTPVR